MIKITIQYKDPTEIMEIVRGLRAQGMVQGTDFDFAYNQSICQCLYYGGHD